MPPAFADPTAQARILTVIAPESLAAHLATLPDQARNWLAATGFKADLGEIQLLPGATGVESAVIGLGSANARARLRFGLVKALNTLPQGAWRLEGDLTAAQKDEAALGWLLAQYRFDRYRKQTPPLSLIHI